MKVGDKIWHFDSNRRRYIEDTSTPDRRHMWHEVTITGETSRSWVTAYGKVPKKGFVYGWAKTYQEVKDDLWIERNAYKVRMAVEHIARRFNTDRTMLRSQLEQIAFIAGLKDLE